MEKDDQTVCPLRWPKTLEELEAELLQSIHQLDEGKGEPGENVMRRLRQRMEDTRA